MPNAITVLNPESLSLKLLPHALAGSQCELISRGQVEGLETRPRIMA